MGRLWRSVVILALCLAAVIAMRIYLTNQLAMAHKTSDMDRPAATVE